MDERMILGRMHRGEITITSWKLEPSSFVRKVGEVEATKYSGIKSASGRKQRSDD